MCAWGCAGRVVVGEAPPLPRVHSCTRRERQSSDACRAEGVFGQTGLAGEASASGSHSAIKQRLFSVCTFLLPIASLRGEGRMTEQTLPLSLQLQFLQLQDGEECGLEEFGIFNRIEVFFFFFLADN